jgi:hypothetical protein
MPRADKWLWRPVPEKKEGPAADADREEGGGARRRDKNYISFSSHS